MTNWANAASGQNCGRILFFLGLQKTRLLDPVMSLPGTNDHPGDYRASAAARRAT